MNDKRWSFYCTTIRDNEYHLDLMVLLVMTHGLHVGCYIAIVSRTNALPSAVLHHQYIEWNVWLLWHSFCDSYNSITFDVEIDQ